jgi:hypothetical protein
MQHDKGSAQAVNQLIEPTRWRGDTQYCSKMCTYVFLQESSYSKRRGHHVVECTHIEYCCSKMCTYVFLQESRCSTQRGRYRL